MLGVFQTSTLALEQTLPYHEALFLGEKCLEEVRLGVAEDPYYLTRLLVDGLGADRAAVTGGAHPYFACLEDTAPPFGRLEPGKDWSIQREAGPLFRETGPFRLSIQASLTERSAPAPKEAEAAVALDWVDRRGKAMRYTIAAALKVWVPLARMETVDSKDEETQLGAVLEPAAGKTLSELASARGADPAKLGALARLLLYGQEAAGTMASSASRLAQLRAARDSASGDAARARETLRLARLEEALAARMLGLLERMAVPLETLGRDLPAGSLGSPAPSADVRRLAVEHVRVALESFFSELSGAIASYAELAEADFVPAGWRLAAHLALWRAARIAALTYPWPDRAPLKTYAQGMREYYRGRMPNVEHQMGVEADLLDVPALFPLAAPAAAARLARESYPSAAIRLMLHGVAAPAE